MPTYQPIVNPRVARFRLGAEPIEGQVVASVIDWKTSPPTVSAVVLHYGNDREVQIPINQVESFIEPEPPQKRKRKAKRKRLQLSLF